MTLYYICKWTIYWSYVRCGHYRENRILQTPSWIINLWWLELFHYDSQRLGEIGLHLNIPAFVSSGTQMSQADGDPNKDNSYCHRILVDGTIHKIRTFKIVSHCSPTSIFGDINKGWTVYCVHYMKTWSHFSNIKYVYIR